MSDAISCLPKPHDAGHTRLAQHLPAARQAQLPNGADRRRPPAGLQADRLRAWSVRARRPLPLRASAAASFDDEPDFGCGGITTGASAREAVIDAGRERHGR
jgi:hypothetical protein